MLRNYVSKDQRRWDEHLQKFDCAARTARHEVTGFIPFYLNFGRKFVHSVLLFGKTKSFKEIEAAERHGVELAETFKSVKEKLDRAAARNKRIYDLRSRHREFAPGDLVYRKNYALSDAAAVFASKLAPRYLGPFRVVRRVRYCT